MSQEPILSATDLVTRIREGQWTATESTPRHLAIIAQRNSSLNAFVEVWRDEALERAAQLDRKRASGATLGSLFGVPIGIKSNLCVTGHVCSCSSKMLANYRPTYSATVCQRLLDADAILLGRTNMDEYAMGSGTEYSIYGPTRNPHQEVGPNAVSGGYSPGGSSGGSAAAVAGGMVPIALGSDTGGSIRQPAAFCGVYGLKPTYGRVSRFGLVAYASSLDQIGPIATTPDDLELLFQVIEGPDRHDATSLSRETVQQVETKLRHKSVEQLRVGIIREHAEQDLAPTVRRALEETQAYLKSAGATLVEVSLPRQAHAIATYYLIASCEAASNLSRYDGMHFGHRANVPEQNATLEQVIAASRGEGFGAEVKRRIMLGTYALSHGYAEQYYQQATRMRQAIRLDFATAFANVDVLLGPTTPGPAFPIGAHRQDPIAMYLTDQFTVSANLAGLPAISVPIELGKLQSNESRLPVAVQFHAPPCGESRLFSVAKALHERNQTAKLGAVA
ncbi:MAG: Asp-tRNA(Asn)/Glu-tRNA(Gln) amidotransferase subunit GatA [Pirellulaceae bacterium]|nr:Asp-tRNA(Asn)/Glu-tRNA(Gln) amidotransferase subunit GatA [Pirellulaceae bacterium]